MGNTKADADIEAAALAAMSEGERAVATQRKATEPIPDRPLPDGLVNQPCGSEGHYCLDVRGHYQPKFMQILIQRTQKNQMDPQYVRAGDIEAKIPLEVWCDVHPGIVEALKDSTEVRHEQNYNEAAKGPGENPGIVQRPVRRFSIETMRSA